MGFLDKATGGLTNRFQRSGEETVRMVDHDKTPEPEEKGKRSSEPKAARPKLSDLLPSRGSKQKASLVEDSYEEDDDESLDVPDEFDGSDLPLAYKVAADTAFDLDDDESGLFPQAPNAWGGETLGSDTVFGDLPEAAISSSDQPEGVELDFDEGKINDVLEVLKIPATFVIPSDILMPGDFDNVEFDLQVPQGYDIGQVEFFVERAEGTVKEYLRLLEQRNEHVAKLATTIDRLQVDLQNLKYDSQIAAGIGIMPTSDNDELEKDNMELKLKVKRLEDQLKNKTVTPNLSSKERELYENMRNEYSIIQREKEDLDAQVLELKTRIAQMEEDADDPLWMAGSQTASSEESLPAFDFGGGGIEYMDDFSNKGLPNVEQKEEGNSISELPDLDLGSFTHSKPADDFPTAFEIDDDDEMPDPARPIVSSEANSEDDDDDDELNKLMKGWS